MQHFQVCTNSCHTCAVERAARGDTSDITGVWQSPEHDHGLLSCQQPIPQAADSRLLHKLCDTLYNHVRGLVL